MTAVKLIFVSVLSLSACDRAANNHLHNSKQDLSEKTGIELIVINEAEKIVETDAMRLRRWFRGVSTVNDVVQAPLHKVRARKTVELPGISFLVNGDKANVLLDTLNKKFAGRDCIAFVSDDTYREDNKQTISIIHTTDKYDIIRLQETCGGVYTSSTDSLIAKLKQLEQKYAFDFIAVGDDWMVLRPKRPVDDWVDYAAETLKVCAPEDDVENVAAYAAILKEDKGKVLLWWE